MLTFKQYLREMRGFPTNPQYSAACTLRMCLRDFIATLESYDALKSEEECAVDIRLDYPVYDSLTVQLVAQSTTPSS